MDWQSRMARARMRLARHVRRMRPASVWLFFFILFLLPLLVVFLDGAAK
jgi:hypothetical protein